MMKISGPLVEPCGVPNPKLTQILKYGHQFEQIALFHKGRYRTVSREYVSRDFNCRRTFCDRLCSARARTIMAQSWPGISWPLIHSSYPIPRAVEVLHQHDNPLGMSGACLWTESHSAPKRKKVTNRVSDKLFPIKDLRMTNASLVDSPSNFVTL